jgi:8-oxo-dGTP pyrophosphatase MutT (NUDIX family)
VTVYVAGFLLDDTGRVVLVRKNRPEWQAGKLNAVGGKIEPGEEPYDAMRREFYEEAGLGIHGWDHFATVAGEGFAVWFYRLRTHALVLDRWVRTMTDETIEVHQISDILDQFAHDSSYAEDWDEHRALPNLSWLLPLAAYTHDTYLPVIAHEVS